MSGGAVRVLRRVIGFFRRSVRVDRIREDHDDFMIVIADGIAAPQMLSVRRNDLCSIAWCLVRTKEWRALHTITWRGWFYSDEEHEVILRVPRWARRKLLRKVVDAAVSVGWKGECYRPGSYPYRAAS